MQNLADVRRDAHRKGSLVFLRFADPNQPSRHILFVEISADHYDQALRERKETRAIGGGYWRRFLSKEPETANSSNIFNTIQKRGFIPVDCGPVGRGQYTLADRTLRVADQLVPQGQIRRSLTNNGSQTRLSFGADNARPAGTLTPRAVPRLAKSPVPDEEAPTVRPPEAGNATEAPQTDEEDLNKTPVPQDLTDEQLGAGEETAEQDLTHPLEEIPTTNVGRTDPAADPGSDPAAYPAADPAAVPAPDPAAYPAADPGVHPAAALAASPTRAGQQPQATATEFEPQPRGRLESLVWDTGDLPVDYHARMANNRGIDNLRETFGLNGAGQRNSARVDSLPENAGIGAGSSAYTPAAYINEVGRAFRAAQSTHDERVREAGILMADFENLHQATTRTSLYGDAGYPSVLPQGRRIQTPCPDLISTDLVEDMNAIMHECSVRLTERLHRAQLEHMEMLQTRALTVLGDLQPTEDQKRGLEKVMAGRLNHARPFPDLQPLVGSLPFFLGPNRTKGEALIVPNPAVNSFLSTGNRTPGGGNGANPPNAQRRPRSSSRRGRGRRDQSGYRGNQRDGDDQDGGYASPPRHVDTGGGRGGGGGSDQQRGSGNNGRDGGGGYYGRGGGGGGSRSYYSRK